MDVLSAPDPLKGTCSERDEWNAYMDIKYPKQRKRKSSN